MLIGTLCWTFFKLTGEALPAQFARGDQAFPYFVTHHLPAGFAGLFIAALFGATMANLSSDLNSLAAVAVEDYYRLWFRGSSERARLIAAKVAVVILWSHLHGGCQRPGALQRKRSLALVYDLRDHLGRIGGTV
jgi:SSS family solute:Na+ symporter